MEPDEAWRQQHAKIQEEENKTNKGSWLSAAASGNNALEGALKQISYSILLSPTFLERLNSETRNDLLNKIENIQKPPKAKKGQKNYQQTPSDLLIGHSGEMISASFAMAQDLVMAHLIGYKSVLRTVVPEPAKLPSDRDGQLLLLREYLAHIGYPADRRKYVENYYNQTSSSHNSDAQAMIMHIVRNAANTEYANVRAELDRVTKDEATKQRVQDVLDNLATYLTTKTKEALTTLLDDTEFQKTLNDTIARSTMAAATGMKDWITEPENKQTYEAFIEATINKTIQTTFTPDNVNQITPLLQTTIDHAIDQAKTSLIDEKLIKQTSRAAASGAAQGLVPYIIATILISAYSIIAVKTTLAANPSQKKKKS